MGIINFILQTRKSLHEYVCMCVCEKNLQVKVPKFESEKYWGREGFLSKTWSRASLVVQWLRICLPMQGTQVRALVWEDPTCHGAIRPVSHNY